MLTMWSVKAQNSYPSKLIVGSDTVICSTIEQQKKYLIWKSQLSECKEKQLVYDSTIFLQDSIIKEQKKLIAFYSEQSKNYSKLVLKQDEIIGTVNEKFNIMESTYKKSEKINRRNKFITGLTSGIISLGFIGVLTYQIVK